MRRISLVLGLMLLVIGITNAQTIVTGAVTDAEGESLIGVSILVKGTSAGTVTDLDGTYRITVPAESNTLTFSYTGFATQDVKVNGRTTIDVAMEPSSALLEEVIVTAYGVTTKEAFSGSADVIGAKELANRNVTSPLQAIEGKATGVQFTAPTGGPGSSPGIVIRGVGTLSGDTDPLFVVDGVQFEGALTTINQEDIESITVLKDAASTSLYGARAANGVILITTKRGNNKGTRVNASVQYGAVSRALPLYEEVTPGQYYEIMWEALRNTSAGGGDPQFASDNIYTNLGYNPFDVPNDQIVGTDGRLNPNANVVYQSLNWYDELETSNTRTNMNLNVASGGENHSVFFSTSYLEEGGYIRTSAYDRLTSRVNGDFKANDWLSMGGSANITLTNSSGPSSAGTGSIVNPFGFAKNIGSIYPVFLNDQQGNLVRDASGDPIFDNGEGFPEFNVGSRPINQGRHALQELLLNNERDFDNTYGFRFYGDINFLEGLDLRLTYGQDLNEGVEKEYENNIIGDAQPTGRYSETRFRRQIENFSQVLTYRKSFDVNNFELTLGHESFKWDFTFNDALAVNQTAEGIPEFANFATPIRLDGATDEKRIEGYFARLNYNFNNKYYLSGSIRRDGSSVFNRDVRWGTFFGASASWRLDQEPFIQNLSWVNRLKLRGSFGEVGQDDLGDFYLSQRRFALTSNAGNPAIFFNTPGNAAVTWENTISYDVALDFSLFNNFLDGTIEYYRRGSEGLLFDVPVALSNGLNSFPDNVASIVNSGVELGLTTNLISKPDFRWNIRVTATAFNNEITSLPDPFITGTKRWSEGVSRFEFFLWHSAGVDPETGDQLYFQYEFDEEGVNTIPVLEEDGTHATTNDWTTTERAYTGARSIPDLVGGVSTSLFYKGFSLDVLLNYSIGGEILDFGYANMMHSGDFGSSLHPDIMNAWRQPGDITDVPRMENGNQLLVQTQSTRFLTDASFWTIRNVNLGYTFDGTFVNKIGLSDLRVSLIGENLLFVSKRDGLNPQFNLAGTPAGNGFNPSRIVSIGLNASF